MKYFVIFAFVFLGISSAQAQGLTDANIRSFYQKMAELYDQDSVNEYALLSFLDIHYDDNIQFRINLEANVFPEPQVMDLGKKQVLELTEQTADAMLNLKTSIDIQTIKIEADGQSAVVDYFMKHDGRARHYSPQGQSVDVDYSSVAGCSEAIKFSEKGIIVVKAQCNMRAQYEHPQINEQDL
ncbi:MAG: hypothetical protein AB8B83_08580 [Bdellovibrionales bacterium]